MAPGTHPFRCPDTTIDSFFVLWFFRLLLPSYHDKKKLKTVLTYLIKFFLIISISPWAQPSLSNLQELKEKVKRNYKIAIPHWYEGKIQLLLPLVLTNEENLAELAFVIDKDKQRNIYRGKTILTMDMAYIDARLITKPDDDWLTP